jgi:hypothetical protein
VPVKEETKSQSGKIEKKKKTHTPNEGLGLSGIVTRCKTGTEKKQSGRLIAHQGQETEVIVLI